ncbi:MAG: hypothetical protein ABI441_16120 [Flavobacterium sp.]
MKSKLRKIVVNDLEYLYSVNNKYHLGTETCTLTIKVFLREQKQTPLIIDFLTVEHYFVGQVLNTGINLINKITNSTDLINLNEPNYIRNLILLGQKHGWIGINKIENQDGLNYLAEMGYETEVLKPKT